VAGPLDLGTEVRTSSARREPSDAEEADVRADEIMTDRVITTRATQTIADAITALTETDVRHLPVLGDAGQLVGMLSDRDIRSLGLTRALDLEATQRLHERLRQSVASAMSADVATIGPELEMPQVIDAMLDNRVGALPVVDDDTDQLLGIVSYVDVLRVLRDASAEA
jgi:acetoin utilization protein AcuB